RYWAYQTEVAADLRARAEHPVEAWTPAERDALRRGLARSFASEGPRAADPRQRLAAVSAARHRLCVISGGPGTGKTTTVVRVLALLAEQAQARGEPLPRIQLLAPTGKAAARLVESIQAGRDQLDCAPEIRAAIPDQAATIHRRLGMRPGSPTRFFHDRDHPLPAEIVLVDEASMVDLALMAKLLQAVPRDARLILLGDKDQLASVEAGAILGAICNVEGDRGYSSAFAHEIEALLGEHAPAALEVTRTQPGIWDCVVELTRSFRFDASGGIGRLAQAINRGDGDEAVRQVEGGTDPHVQLVDLPNVDALVPRLEALVVPAFRPMLRERDPVARLQALHEFRLLAAHRRGPFGTEHVNRLIESILRSHGLIRGGTSEDGEFDGRPILVTHNDYQLDLFNGDVGILHRDPSTQDLRA